MKVEAAVRIYRDVVMECHGYMRHKQTKEVCVPTTVLQCKYKQNTHSGKALEFYNTLPRS